MRLKKTSIKCVCSASYTVSLLGWSRARLGWSLNNFRFFLGFSGLGAYSTFTHAFLDHDNLNYSSSVQTINGCIFNNVSRGVSWPNYAHFSHFICLNRHPATFPMSNSLYSTSKLSFSKFDLFPVCISYPLKNGIFSKMEGVLSRGVETTLLIKLP